MAAVTVEQQRALALARARRRRSEANAGASSGNVNAPSQAYTDALAAGSAASQKFAPEKQSGLLANLGAGFDNGVNSVLGAPVDLPVWLGNSLINATNSGAEMVGAGRPIPNIPVDLPGSRLGFERAQEGLGFTPQSQVEANTTGERLVRGVGDAVGQSILPEVLLARGAQAVASGAQQVAPVIRQGVEMLEPMFGAGTTAGRMAANTAVNAAAGGGASVAADIAPDPIKPAAALVGGLVAGTPVAMATAAPAAARAAAGVANDFLAPVTRSGQERIAGQTLRDAATSPSDVIDAIENAPASIVPGSMPTTFQQTGDMGLGALERGVAARNPADFQTRRADQNAARLESLGGVQRTGAPEQVASTVRGFIRAIDDEATAAVDAATTSGAQQVARVTSQAGDAVNAVRGRAQEATDALGSGRAPEIVGGDLRNALEASRAAAKTEERALWTAVDPDNSLALPVSSTKQQLQGIIDDITPVSAKPEGAEASIYSDLSKLGDGAMPFRFVTELDSRVKTALREERLARGESAAYRRLSRLKSAIENDLDSAISTKVANEQQAVQSGQMSLEQTAAYRIEQWQKDWKQRQTEARAYNAGSASADGGIGQASVLSPRGTAGQAGVRSGSSSGNQGLSPDGLETNFDADALGRLKDARLATRNRAETFDNATLAPIRKRPMASGPYDMGAAAVPARIFFPGAKSVDAIATYRKAVGDEQAMNLLSDYIVDRLRKTAMGADGILDPAKVVNFQRSHADALRSFPELNARFGNAANAAARIPVAEAATSQAVKDVIKTVDESIAATAAIRKERLDDAQKGVLGKLIGVDDPSDVTRTVGAIFARQDAVAEMGRLRSAIGSDEQGLEGLRKSIVDYVTNKFVSNAEAGTSGKNQIKADGFQTFIRSNEGALRAAGFTDDEVKVMQAISDDIRQANASITAVKIPGGSNTTQDVLAAKVTDTPTSIMAKIAAASAVTGGAASIASPLIGLPVGIATGLIGAMRQIGLTKVDDIIKDAMLNPQRAKLLIQKAKPRQQEQIGKALAQQYRRAVVGSTASGLDNDQKSRNSYTYNATSGRLE